MKGVEQELDGDEEAELAGAGQIEWVFTDFARVNTSSSNVSKLCVYDMFGEFQIPKRLFICLFFRKRLVWWLAVGSSLDVCRRQTTIGSGEAAVVWTNNSCTRIQIKWHCELLLFCRIAVYMLSLSNQLRRHRIWRDKCNSTGLFACTWLPSYPPLAVWFILLLLSLNIANIFCNLCAHLRYKNFCCFIIRRLSAAYRHRKLTLL